MSRKIALTQGEYAIVDEQDYELLNKYNWQIDSDGYAVRSKLKTEGKGHKVRMHRQIMNTPKDMECDHANGNRLDNRRENLRNCTRGENARNSKPHKNNTSGFKGVTWNKRDQTYKAYIRVNDINIHLGYFRDPVEGAKAYDKAARGAWGEFAYLNFPNEI